MTYLKNSVLRSVFGGVFGCTLTICLGLSPVAFAATAEDPTTSAVMLDTPTADKLDSEAAPLLAPDRIPTTPYQLSLQAVSRAQADAASPIAIAAATELIQQAVAQAPRDQRVLANYAVVLMYQNLYREALAVLDELLGENLAQDPAVVSSNDPTPASDDNSIADVSTGVRAGFDRLPLPEADLRLNRSLVLRALGRYQAAQRDYQRYLSMHSNIVNPSRQAPVDQLRSDP